jgi:predicted nucleotidyltransferase
MLSLMKMQKEYINITSYLQQAETQARQILHYAFHRLLTPNSQFKDVNAAKAVNP